MSPMNPRLLRPLASGGFNPKSISGLIAWYDASDTANVTLDSGRVSGLTDKSGSGNNATNNTSGTTQPSYETGARNGRNVARFAAASNQSLNIPAISLSALGSYTSFYSFWRASSGHRTFFLGGGLGSSRHDAHWAANNIAYQHTSGTFTEHGTASTATGGFVFATRRTGTVSVLIRRNKTLLSEVTTGDGITMAMTGNFSSLGQTQAVYAQQDFGEGLLYSRALSDAEMQSVEDYLMRRWGIT